MLAHIETEVRRSGYQRLSLETGSTPGFTAAHRLYVVLGLQECGPFANYKEDPYSVFLTKALK